MRDNFGAALALSADGATLATNSRGEASAASGAFHPGDPGYAVAIANNAAPNAGAAYPYRRSAAGRWALDSYVKAANTDTGPDQKFACTLALSADGAALAVGAPVAGSDAANAEGVFAPARRATRRRWRRTSTLV